MVNDTISDMLTRIRNANMVKHPVVQIPATKMSVIIAKILEEEGFVTHIETCETKSKTDLLLFLKYIGKAKEPVISKIERVSKPGLRVYTSCRNLPKVLDNFGIAIVSTSKGVMTNQKAKELGIGGEILCYIS